jgi:hypothetical protein
LHTSYMCIGACGSCRLNLAQGRGMLHLSAINHHYLGLMEFVSRECRRVTVGERWFCYIASASTETIIVVISHLHRIILAMISLYILLRQPSQVYQFE